MKYDLELTYAALERCRIKNPSSHIARAEKRFKAACDENEFTVEFAVESIKIDREKRALEEAKAKEEARLKAVMDARLGVK